MKALSTAVLIAGLISTASAAHADGAVDRQDIASQNSEEPAGSSEIIVQAPVGSNERRIQLREMASDIINQPRNGRTVATYFRGICPKVIGLPAAETALIEERIRENAQALGANRRIPQENCTPNVTVIFVPANMGPPEAWMTYENDMLGHLLSYQKLAVLEESDPVRAWTVNRERSADGAPLPNATGQRVSGALDFSNSLRSASRLRVNATVEITEAAILIELASAQGKTLKQLADYASMRSFGNSRALEPDATPAAETILTLFRDDDPPEGLTTFDRALISKLYATSRNANARRYYSNIAARALDMERDNSSDGS